MSDHHPYIDLHWLYQIALVGLDRLGGGPALVLAHAALIVGAFAVVARVTWQRFRSALVVAVVLLLGVLASELRFMIRPETVSWLFLAVIMLILERRAAGQAAPLWVLPIIHLAWVNVEGLFVLGWIVTGCYLVGGLLEQHRLDRSLAIWGGASVLISFVNPYFIQGVLFPVTLMTRMSKENPFGQTISEFVSPWQLNLPLPWSAWAYYLLAGMVVIGLILTRTQRRPWEFLLALAFLLLSALAIRNIPLFVIVAMPILAGCLCNLSQMFASRHGKKTRPSGRVAAWLETARRLPVGAVLIVLVSVGLTLRVLTDAYYISARRPNRFGFDVSAADLPVKAVSFMRARGISGRIFNHMNYGGYLMWQLSEPVFIDGRLEVMGEAFYQEYQTAGQKNQFLLLLKRYDAQVAIFPYQAAVSWLQQLRAAPEWRLVYYDDQSVIYVRADAYPQLAEAVFPTLTPGGLAIPVPAETRARLLYAPRAGGLGCWSEGFWRKPVLPRETINRGIFYYYLDQLDAAEAFLLDALQASQESISKFT